MTIQELFNRFQQRLTAVGGECHLVEQVAAAADLIVAHAALAGREIVVPPAFAEREPWGAMIPLLRDRGIHIREAESPASVADAPAGLSCAELAIAETGSVLIAENALEARAVSMLTLTHFVLVRTQDLVPMLDEGGALLQQLTRPGPQQRRYISFVTGPSRTADIERTLSIGVQGPKAICVLFIPRWETQV
ncbi:MAG TPA: lactate utilization protein [Ktedonosporobacter sp.]|nr:lactate utilization protein [Ktedonosporobacter sp.]